MQFFTQRYEISVFFYILEVINKQSCNIVTMKFHNVTLYIQGEVGMCLLRLYYT